MGVRVHSFIHNVWLNQTNTQKIQVLWSGCKIHALTTRGQAYLWRLQGFRETWAKSYQPKQMDECGQTEVGENDRLGWTWRELSQGVEN